MDDLDPHLEILLQDFVRLCPDDAPLEQDDWAGLQEICRFIREQAIQCTAATLGEYLLHQGCSPHKATVIMAQYDQYLQQLKAGDQRPHATGSSLQDAPPQQKEVVTGHTRGLGSQCEQS